MPPKYSATGLEELLGTHVNDGTAYRNAAKGSHMPSKGSTVGAPVAGYATLIPSLLKTEAWTVGEHRPLIHSGWA